MPNGMARLKHRLMRPNCQSRRMPRTILKIRLLMLQ
jgi:hypothetical protein